MRQVCNANDLPKKQIQRVDQTKLRAVKWMPLWISTFVRQEVALERKVLHEEMTYSEVLMRANCS